MNDLCSKKVNTVHFDFVLTVEFDSVKIAQYCTHAALPLLSRPL